MASLNVEEILTGTPEKAFLAARKELAEDYNETSANEFFYSYCEQPLSFILRHSRDIFSETYFGYDFYVDLIDHYTYDPRTYATEADKVREYIDLAKERKLPSNQIEKYELLLERLIQYSSANTNFCKCMTIAASSEGGEEFFENVFDYLYDIEQDKKMIGSSGSYEADDVLIKLDNLAESIFVVKNVYCKLTAGLIFCSRNPSYAPYLIEATREISHEFSKDEDLGDIQRLGDCVSLLMKDEPTKEMIYKISGPVGGVAEYWEKIAVNKDRAIGLAKEKTEKAVSNIQADLAEHPISSDVDGVLEIPEVVSNESFQEAMLCERYDNYSRLHSIYEAKLEATSVEGDLIAENASDIVNAIEAEISYMEWEDDGSPNAVIAKHIMTSKEKEQLAVEKEKRTLQNSLASSNAEKEAAISSESNLCKNIKADIEKLGNVDGMAHLGMSDDKIMDMIKGIRSNLEKYKKEAEASDYKRALALCNDLEDELKISDPMYEAFDSKVDRHLQMFLESDSLKDDLADEAPKAAKGEKPVKPKTDLATKIQNKALDRAAKDEQRLAKNKEKTQKLKNAANAVASTPKRIVDDAKKLVADFDKWDDNRRKEFLLKPGYRHKVVKVMKNALIAGSVASASLALVPLLAMCKHCSNLKDKRIRNELAKELENEIRICEEKINDANSAGDNKTKYELMRIKDKLEAEKRRVRINSNYL